MQLQLASASAGETEADRRAPRSPARVRATSSPSRASSAPGKTTFVRGACRALGVTAPVTSPTFTIGHRYAGTVERLAPRPVPLHRGLAGRVGRPRAVLRRRDRLRRVARGRCCDVLPPAARPVTLEHAGARSRGASSSRRRGGAATRPSLMLVLAFDTATDLATSALVDDGDVLGERVGVARTARGRRRAARAPGGRRPRHRRARRRHRAGKLHEHADRARGRARARARARRPGRRRLDPRALASAQPGAFPVVDARRGEVFVAGPRAVAPDDLELEPGTLCIGSGAVRYRDDARARWGPSCRPTTTTGTSRTRGCTRPSRASSGRSTRSSRSTCASPTPKRRSRERRAPPRSTRTISTSSRRSSASRIRRRGRARCSTRSCGSRARSRSARSRDDDVLVGYAFVSRYVDAWHVMNVAVADAFRRRGIASALLERLFEVTGDRSAARLHARGARLERAAPSGCTSSSASRRAASGAATTRTTARTRSSCGASRLRPSAPRDPRARDVVRRDRRRRRDRATDACSRRSSRRRRSSTPASAASSPRSRRGVTSSSSRRSCATALESAGRDPGRRRAGRRDPGPGPRRRAARRHLGGQGARLVEGAAARPGRPSRGARRVAVPRARSARAAVHLPARERRAHAAARRARARARRSGSGRRSTMRRARRSTRAPGSSASAIRAARRSTGWRSDGDPDAFDFPVARVPGPRLLVLGPQDRAPVRGARPRPGRDGAPEGRSRGLVPARDRPRARGPARARPPRRPGLDASRSSAASRRTRSFARRCPTRAFAPLELCTDNAAMIASCARFVEPLLPPRYLALDAYASLA